MGVLCRGMIMGLDAIGSHDDLYSPITDVDDLVKPFDLNEKLRDQVPSFLSPIKEGTRKERKARKGGKEGTWSRNF